MNRLASASIAFLACLASATALAAEAPVLQNQDPVSSSALLERERQAKLQELEAIERQIYEASGGSIRYAGRPATGTPLGDYYERLRQRVESEGTRRMAPRPKLESSLPTAYCLLNSFSEPFFSRVGSV